MCNLVKSILEGDSNAKKIPIKKVRGDILELIVNYLKHHNGKKPEEIAKPIRSVKMERIVADQCDEQKDNISGDSGRKLHGFAVAAPSRVRQNRHAHQRQIARGNQNHSR